MNNKSYIEVYAIFTFTGGEWRVWTTPTKPARIHDESYIRRVRIPIPSEFLIPQQEIVDASLVEDDESVRLRVIRKSEGIHSHVQKTSK